MIAQLLKQHTSSTHARVEDGLALVDPALTVSRLQAILERFHGFWSVTEAQLDGWARAEPHRAATLDWPRRRRTALLRADLEVLGHDAASVAALPEAEPVFADPTTADALGWLYVSEGSTLGGAVITRHLAGCVAVPGDVTSRLRSFAPYAEGPGAMWRSYLEGLREYADDDVRTRAVLDAATASFDALARWLEPLMAEAAA